MKAFEEIWQEYYPKLTVFLRTSFHFEETDDLVQEIMLKIYSKMETYKPAWSLNTWIYSIARNHAIDSIKKSSSRLRMVENVRAEAVLADNHSVSTETLVLEKELKESVAVFIAGLPENERQVSFLKYYGEMDYREISRVTGLPVGTIKYLVHRIKMKFAEYYGEHYED